jgi:hypothetical protein
MSLPGVSAGFYIQIALFHHRLLRRFSRKVLVRVSASHAARPKSVVFPVVYHVVTANARFFVTSDVFHNPESVLEEGFSHWIT